jgi:AraC family transcriptional regulator
MADEDSRGYSRAVSCELHKRVKRDTKQAESCKVNLMIEDLRSSVMRTALGMNHGWKGAAVEDDAPAEVEPCESPSEEHLIVVWDARQGLGNGAQVKPWYVGYVKRRELASLVPNESFLPQADSSEMKVMVSATSPSWTNGMEDKLQWRAVESLNDRLNLLDAGLHMLTSLLITEAETGGPCGRLYADTLIEALETRFVELRRAMPPRERSTTSGLPGHLLRRVLERMNSEFCANLGLATLAAECGYSRAHFVRLFRAATAQTPHQYLVNVRLASAVRMMRDRSRSLMDIAIACGFSSHTHFTKVFRTKFGVLPSQYRRVLQP